MKQEPIHAIRTRGREAIVLLERLRERIPVAPVCLEPGISYAAEMLAARLRELRAEIQRRGRRA